MPELPEVEVLARHLRPQLQNARILSVLVRRERVLAGTPIKKFIHALRGAAFAGLSRRGKYLLFEMRHPRNSEPFTLVGHLGMTGRMYLLPAKSRLPKHAAIVFELGDHSFVFEDTRYFGRITLDTCAIEKLGPEPLDREFTTEKFGEALKRSKQPIKVKLLDQSLVAGIGNIYASEALFRARISPRLASHDLNQGQVARLWKAIRQVLREAIRGGSTVPLDHAGTGSRDGLFYFGLREGQLNSYEERLRVYNRAGQSCVRCSGTIERFVQAARSTFYCTRCQTDLKMKPRKPKRLRPH